MSKRKVVVIRHAHRKVNEGAAEDNGLSQKGLRQVEKLLSFWSATRKPRRAAFLSSPKKRCLETLGPLAELFGQPLEVEPLLDEQSIEQESEKAFKKRVDAFLRSSKAAEAETLFICSHGDWIPTFFDRVTDKAVKLKKGEWAELDL